MVLILELLKTVVAKADYNRRIFSFYTLAHDSDLMYFYEGATFYILIQV